MGPLIVIAASEYRELEPVLLLRIQMREGGHFDIFIQEQRFMVHFRRLCFRNKHFVLYKFNTVSSGNLDPYIKEVVDKDAVFPDIRFRFFNQKHNFHFLLNAYLDIVLARLKNKKNV